MTTERVFPQWEQFYQDKPVEQMPWYYPGLDPDLEAVIQSLAIRSGRALDLGTGPGTQAIELAERGFSVVGSDLSSTAIEKAQALAQEKGLEIDFRQDDILHSQLRPAFDLILDRGCFHVLAPGERLEYIRQVQRLIRVGGLLCLKCFSHLQPGEQGPHRFTPDAIRALFEGPFKVRSIDETVYQGTLDPLPRALFCVLERT